MVNNFSRADQHIRDRGAEKNVFITEITQHCESAWNEICIRQVLLQRIIEFSTSRFVTFFFDKAEKNIFIRYPQKVRI